MSFSSDIRKAANKMKVGYDELVRASLYDLSAQVMKRTPVGNPDLWVAFDKTSGTYVDYVAYRGYPAGYVGGQARGNWFASINSPKTQPDYNTIDATGAQTLSSIGMVTESAPGNIWYLTNNLPYINRLEFDAWSTQAPKGMVRISLSNFKKAIAKAAREVPKL